MATVGDLLRELKAMRALLEIQLLTMDAGSLFTKSFPVSVTAVGATGPGTSVYHNDSARPVVVMVRDRGGTAQTLSAGKADAMIAAQGGSVSGTAGATTDSQAMIVLPNENVYVRFSASAATVDVLVFDPGAVLRRVDG